MYLVYFGVQFQEILDLLFTLFPGPQQSGCVTTGWRWARHSLCVLPAFGSAVTFFRSPHILDRALRDLRAQALLSLSFPPFSVSRASHDLTDYFLLSHDPPDTVSLYPPTPLPSCKFSFPHIKHPGYCHISLLQVLCDHVMQSCLFRSAPSWPSLHIKVF